MGFEPSSSKYRAHSYTDTVHLNKIISWLAMCFLFLTYSFGVVYHLNSSYHIILSHSIIPQIDEHNKNISNNEAELIAPQTEECTSY